MLDLLPAGWDSGRPHALCRQRVENNREYRNENNADPVMRQANAGDRRRGKQFVEPGTTIEGSERPEQRPEAKAKQRRGDSQHQRIAERAEQLVRDRPIGEERNAEIADQQASEPRQILDMERLVESEAVT